MKKQYTEPMITVISLAADRSIAAFDISEGSGDIFIDSGIFDEEEA